MIVSTSSQPQPIRLENVPRFKDHPIKKIPKYVFENCNQATCNTYDPTYLSLLRERTKVLTAQTLKDWFKEDQTKLMQKGEEFDWVYGLDILEHEFLGEKTPDQLMEELLQVDTVMRYNALFSRFANDNPGEFRKKDIIWAKRDLNINEQIAACFFDPELERQTGNKQAKYFARHHSKKECLVKTAWIKRTYTRLISENLEIEGSAKTKKYFAEHWHEVNVEKAVADWIAEQNRNDGKLDLIKWYKTRYHYFPPIETIAEDLKLSLGGVREAKSQHPIERACRVWFDVVRIHISHEANKRTGKALASIILLANGFLPPKISKEDEKEFLDVLKKGLEEKDGHLRLTQFVAKTILKTQTEYADLAIE